MTDYSQKAIPQTNPLASYMANKCEIDGAIEKVLLSGWYVLGEEVASFEKEFAAYIGVDHAVGVASGTDALCLALKAAGVGPGDAVFTVSLTAVATVAAIELAGAMPVLVDVEPGSLTIDPNRLEDTLKSMRQSTSNLLRPRVIVPVHLYGLPARLPEIVEVAERYELAVIEDCAQSHGASIANRMTGSWGCMGAFSFYPTKNLGAFGDGGIVVTDDVESAERIRMLREYGWRDRYVSEISGVNSRLDELQAAILRAKLPYLTDENCQRERLASVYDAQLRDTHLVLPCRPNGMRHVFHQYVVRLNGRDELKDFLKRHGIFTLVHYPVPIHLQPAYRQKVLAGEGGLTHTERACQEVLSLPMYPQMDVASATFVGELIARWESEKQRSH